MPYIRIVFQKIKHRPFERRASGINAEIRQAGSYILQYFGVVELRYKRFVRTEKAILPVDVGDYGRNVAFKFLQALFGA